MRVATSRLGLILNVGLLLALASGPAMAAAHKAAKTADAPADTQHQIEVTADQSLEWYQDQSVYVARGNAKAVRGEMVVEADTLMAHQPEKDKNAPKAAKPAKSASSSSSASSSIGGGDIDRLTADGNVRITDPKQRVTGGHAVYDMIQKVMVVTGGKLKYETEKESVTARDSLEYWEDKQLAVARGHAVGIRGDRHIEGDVLTAEFRTDPNGAQELDKMTSTGNVVVITKGDVSRGDHMVYDASRNVAVLTGHVRITRTTGMQLAGDVGEVDFTNNTSRLLNQGGGRVRALLPSSKSASTSDTKTGAN